MIRPLYRWKSFWFGVLVLAFLGWNWQDSYRSLSSCFLKFENRELQFARAKGITHVYLRLGGTYLTSLPPGEFQIETSRLRAYWPSVWLWLDNYGAPQARMPDALVFFSFLVPWSGWLAWRWRRLKKLDALQS